MWQTKILVGLKLSDSETAALHAWLSYSDALNALDITAPDIQWPEKTRTNLLKLHTDLRWSKKI